MEPNQNPDIDWYLKVSGERSVTPRCPFASVNRCPRYYESLSLLGRAGSTPILPADDDRLKSRWEKSDIWPKTDETAVCIMGTGDRKTIFSNFCPEVAYDRFGLFATTLVDYADDIDRDLSYRRLKETNVPDKSWRWRWQHIKPIHFSECPLYSPLIHAPQYSKDAEDKQLVTLKPTFMGMGVDINEVLRRYWPRLKKWFGR